MNHLYVIEFDQGTIKVGYSANPEQRIGLLTQEAEQFGIRVANQWVSDPHPDSYKLERKLIAWCTTRASGVCRAEWFTGLDFDAVWGMADSLTFARAVA